MYRTFHGDIVRMNETYELATVADHEIGKRLVQFYKIIGDEITEIEDIIEEHGEASSNLTSPDILRIKTGLADLLADVMVFCASEAVRWNIPLAPVLHVVMQSNFSKLGADGKPIKDKETGKFLKGPNYWKPEPQIAEILRLHWEGVELPNPEELKAAALRLAVAPIKVAGEPLVDSPVQSQNHQEEHRP